MIHLVLVAPEIHWNTGNLGRTALALDATLHLVAPLGFSLDDKHLRRAGLDYWPRVRLELWRDWAHFEAALPSLGKPHFFSAEATRLHWDVSYPEQTVLIFGSESVGLPATLRAAHRQDLVRIPMHDPELRSLNLSTAAAVVGYEVARQHAVTKPRRQES